MEMIGDNMEINDGEKDGVMEIIPVMMRIYLVNILCDPQVDGNQTVNTLRPRQNGRHFADNIFKCIFLN